jgi:hypothetical protein
VNVNGLPAWAIAAKPNIDLFEPCLVRSATVGRGHDLRRTMISLAQDDGASRDSM